MEEIKSLCVKKVAYKIKWNSKQKYITVITETDFPHIASICLWMRVDNTTFNDIPYNRYFLRVEILQFDLFYRCIVPIFM
jgi:hypothetical protein